VRRYKMLSDFSGVFKEGILSLNGRSLPANQATAPAGSESDEESGAYVEKVFYVEKEH
jgi:hypothetical protein